MESEDSPSPPPPNEPPPTLPPPPVPARLGKSSHAKQDSLFTEHDDVDEEISQLMTASYSEISFKSGISPENEDTSLSLSLESMPLAEHIMQRPLTLPCDRNVVTKSLGPLTMAGTVHMEGNMTHFVAEDLEYKIKLSSPVSKKGDTPPLSGSSRSGTPSSLFRQVVLPQMQQLDIGLLNDLECEAHRMATSVDNLTENLCGILHSISSITADNVEVYKNAVSKMSDAMDSNIKSMYTMMAKAEEVTQTMKNVQSHATRIKEIRRLVDLFDSFV